MKKKLLVLLLAVLCVAMLTGCFCQHEWLDATCTDPSTCSKCEKTEGEPLGHVWLDATCLDPQTCQVCGATEGEPNGHSWADATCVDPQTCEVCGETEGEALGHDWQDATTEQPKTCAVCGETEGDRIITDPRFTTAETAAIQGKWGYTMSMTGEDMGIAGFEGTMDCMIILHFDVDGMLGFGMEIQNQDAFMDQMVAYTVDSTYAEFAAQGLSKEAADAAVKDAYNMTMEEYIRSYLSEIDFNAIFAEAFSALSGVYYMEDGVLYIGTTWDEPFEEDPYTLENDTLVIDSLSAELGTDAVFTRIEE